MAILSPFFDGGASDRGLSLCDHTRNGQEQSDGDSVTHDGVSKLGSRSAVHIIWLSAAPAPSGSC
jgi:hypothetical protein